MPFRESLGKTFSPWAVARTTFWLQDLDEKGNKIYPEDHDPAAYRDDILFVLTGFFGVFCAVMGISYVRGVKNGKLYIDKLKADRSQ